MGSAVVFVIVTLIVGALLFGISIVVFGRGEALPAVARDETLTALPRDAIRGNDARSLVFGVKARGYDMAEVDWAIEQLASEIDRLRAALPQGYDDAASQPHDEARKTSSRPAPRGSLVSRNKPHPHRS